jgi:hypothetical protein
MLDTLAEGEVPALFRVVMDMALAGDMYAARIILDRVWVVRKGRPIKLEFPENLDPSASLDVVAKAVAAGEISPEEAANVTGVLLAQARLAAAPRPRDTGKRVMVYLPSNGRERAPGPGEPALPAGVAEAIARASAPPATQEPPPEARQDVPAAAPEREEPVPLPEEPEPVPEPLEALEATEILEPPPADRAPEQLDEIPPIDQSSSSPSNPSRSPPPPPARHIPDNSAQMARWKALAS